MLLVGPLNLQLLGEKRVFFQAPATNGQVLQRQSVTTAFFGIMCCPLNMYRLSHSLSSWTCSRQQVWTFFWPSTREVRGWGGGGGGGAKDEAETLELRQVEGIRAAQKDVEAGRSRVAKHRRVPSCYWVGSLDFDETPLPCLRLC